MLLRVILSIGLTMACLMSRPHGVAGAESVAERSSPATAAPAGPRSFKPLSFESLCEIHTITEGPYNHNHAYPTARAFTRDSRSIFVESSGPGPDGVVKKNVQHLLAIDIGSGSKQYLARIEHPDPDTTPGGFMFDYAPDAHCIAYVDATAHRIHLLNLATKREGVVLEEPEGTLGGPLTTAWDGTRIAYWAMMPSVANRFFDDYITVIFYIDVDPAECKALSEPKIVEAYPRRKGPTWSEKSIADAVHVNHPQINPKDKDHLCFSHEMRGSRPDGTIARCRLWHTRMDESRKEPLIRQPAGLDFTHEVIAPDGKSLIFPYMLGVGQVFFDTLERRSIYYNPDCCPGHLTVSPDSKWIAGDTWGRWKVDGRELQSIMMFDVATRHWAHICWFNHSHPHPIFSLDGTKIAFSHKDDDGFQQISWIDVRDVQRSWTRVAQGVGGEASPKWR